VDTVVPPKNEKNMTFSREDLVYDSETNDQPPFLELETQESAAAGSHIIIGLFSDVKQIFKKSPR